VTLVDLWATWCSPCVRSLPAWQALYDERLQSEGLAFVAISFDDEREDAARFVRERGLTFPIAWDPVGEATARRHRDGSLLPTTLIVDCAGTIRHVHEGYHGPESLDRLADHAAALQGEPSCQEP
jgi:peroxiredoxin